MMKQYQIAEALKIDNGNLSRILKGKRPVPWSMAEMLADLFPAKDVRAWKRATPAELKRAFAQLSTITTEESVNAA
jgi:plasmid maintenance system antidote protein VapI